MLTSNPSLEKVCHRVNSGTEQKYVLPRFIQTRRSSSYSKVFAVIWQIADRDGDFVLDAQQIADQTGISRKTVYVVLSYLKKIILSKINRPVLEVIEERTGRGQHSTYRLNWKSRAPHFSRKCHIPLPNKRLRKNIQPSVDTLVSPTDKFLWRKVMVNFRGLMSKSKLSSKDRNTVIAMIGRYIKNKAIEKIRGLFHRIKEFIEDLRKPDRIKTARELCAWFMASVHGEKRERKRKTLPKFEDANDRIWDQVAREKENILRRRGGSHKSAEESWRDWGRGIEADKAYRKKVADECRERLKLERALGYAVG